jgi:hypothetical protein
MGKACFGVQFSRPRSSGTRGWKRVLLTKKRERKMSWDASKHHKKENKLVYGPEPAPKFLTTRGLLIRGVIFLLAISGIVHLLWKEFSGK